MVCVQVVGYILANTGGETERQWRYWSFVGREGKGTHLLIDTYAVRYLYMGEARGVGGWVGGKVTYLLIDMYAIRSSPYLRREQNFHIFYSVCRMQLRSVTSECIGLLRLRILRFSPCSME